MPAAAPGEGLPLLLSVSLGDAEEYLGPDHAAKAKLIKGFFSDSLTPSLKAERGMRPALLIDVDVDLYISAYQCLDWMFGQGLIVAGTVVYYDDVSVVKANEGGELMAHAQLTDKYQVEWRQLHESCWECICVGVQTAALPAS